MFSGSNSRSCPRNGMRKVFQVFFHSITDPSPLLPALFFFLKLPFCLRDLCEQFNEILPSQRQSSSCGHVPILHYNHPSSLTQRNCRSSLPFMETRVTRSVFVFVVVVTIKQTKKMVGGFVAFKCKASENSKWKRMQVVDDKRCGCFCSVNIFVFF